MEWYGSELLKKYDAANDALWELEGYYERNDEARKAIFCLRAELNREKYRAKKRVEERHVALATPRGGETHDPHD